MRYREVEKFGGKFHGKLSFSRKKDEGVNGI